MSQREALNQACDCLGHLCFLTLSFAKNTLTPPKLNLISYHLIFQTHTASTQVFSSTALKTTTSLFEIIFCSVALLLACLPLIKIIVCFVIEYVFE